MKNKHSKESFKIRNVIMLQLHALLFSVYSTKWLDNTRLFMLLGGASKSPKYSRNVKRFYTFLHFKRRFCLKCKLYFIEII